MAEAVLLPRSSDTILDTGMSYWVQNNTNKRLTSGDGKTDLLRYNRVIYRCEAGEKVIVPWAVIALYFGDPRSQHSMIRDAEDSQGKHQIPARGNELLRLTVFYGCYEQGLDILANMVPDVTITTLDGKDVVPPCFDPEGEKIYGYQRSMERSGDLATIVDSLERQLDEIRARQEIIEQRGDNDGQLKVDTPGMP